MDIKSLLKSVINMADSMFNVSKETFNVATFWINHVTGRQYIPADGMLVTIT